MNKSMSKAEAFKTLKDIEAKHNRLVRELMAVLDAPEQKGLWQPKAGDNYWSLYCGGFVSETKAYTRTTADDMTTIAAHGLVFPSPHIARKAAPLLAIQNKWIAAAFQADPTAGEWAEGRRWLVWSERGTLRISLSVWDVASPAYVHTREQADEMKRILIAEGLGK